MPALLCGRLEMKVKVRAIVIFKWEEDSKSWSEHVETPEALLALVKDYVKDDISYVLGKYDSYTIEIEDCVGLLISELIRMANITGVRRKDLHASIDLVCDRQVANLKDALREAGHEDRC
jgi:hypothetical protein